MKRIEGNEFVVVTSEKKFSHFQAVRTISGELVWRQKFHFKHIPRACIIGNDAIRLCRSGAVQNCATLSFFPLITFTSALLYVCVGEIRW